MLDRTLNTQVDIIAQLKMPWFQGSLYVRTKHVIESFTDDDCILGPAEADTSKYENLESSQVSNNKIFR